MSITLIYTKYPLSLYLIYTLYSVLNIKYYVNLLSIKLILFLVQFLSNKTFG